MKLITVIVKISFEDDKGRMKSRRETYLVNAKDFGEAMEIVKDEFKGMSENWEIVRISPSKVVSVLNYDGGRFITNRSVENKVQEVRLT